MFDSKLAEPGSEEERLLQQLDPARLPRHIAIIMDGNGRWARQRGLPRAVGHRAGVTAVRDTVEAAARLRIPLLTLYAFSQENWKRPVSEVNTLMSLLREYLKQELEELASNNIQLLAIGRLEDLPEAVQRDVSWAVRTTSRNTGMRLCIALSYGGRTEIVDACRSILRAGLSAEELDIEEFARHLYAPEQADPDLLIRTSGEMRISNFLLWQVAYSEIWVTETLWPDFRRRHLLSAVLDYQRRERRYGGLAAGKKQRRAVLARS